MLDTRRPQDALLHGAHQGIFLPHGEIAPGLDLDLGQLRLHVRKELHPPSQLGVGQVTDRDQRKNSRQHPARVAQRAAEQPQVTSRESPDAGKLPALGGDQRIRVGLAGPIPPGN